MQRIEMLYEQVMLRMDMTKETGEEELQEIIRCVIDEEGRKEFLSLGEKIKISRELFNAFRRLDILQDLIEDDEITEIMVNGTENIFYEKKGKLYQTDRHFLSEERLNDVIQQIVGEANRYVNEASPIVDARLKDGSRVNVVLQPVAVNGPVMTIRKFPSDAVTMRQLIYMESLTKEAAAFLEKLVRSKYNIFVSGGTGAGKTTFLNAMTDFIPKDERIITIEDNAELQIQGVANLVRLEARGPNMEGEGAVTIRELIRSALRMRPDRIIVGEVRGEETVDIMPLFLGLFVIILHSVFYYHDKAVINGAAGETAILGAQAQRGKEEPYDLEAFFKKRTKGRLIYLNDVDVSVEQNKNEVTVSASAKRLFMKLSVSQKALIVTPEKKIRQMRWIE